MPLVKVVTSQNPTPERTQALLGELSTLLAAELGKPESYVMTCLEGGRAMTFAGNNEPTCFVEVKNVGRFTPEKTAALSAKLCQKLEAGLGVPAARTYVEFADAAGYLWGYDSATFG